MQDLNKYNYETKKGGGESAPTGPFANFKSERDRTPFYEFLNPRRQLNTYTYKQNKQEFKICVNKK